MISPAIITVLIESMPITVVNKLSASDSKAYHKTKTVTKSLMQKIPLKNALE
jgi:hypothetical protein